LRQLLSLLSASDSNFRRGPRLRFSAPRREGPEVSCRYSAAKSLGLKLEGQVVTGSGGDWPLFRTDGVVVFDARYLLRARDGALIHIVNRGFAHAATPEIQQKIDRGEDVDPAGNYFRLAPVLRNAHRDRTNGSADSSSSALVRNTLNHSIFHYFIVR